MRLKRATSACHLVVCTVARRFKIKQGLKGYGYHNASAGITTNTRVSAAM